MTDSSDRRFIPLLALGAAVLAVGWILERVFELRAVGVISLGAGALLLIGAVLPRLPPAVPPIVPQGAPAEAVEIPAWVGQAIVLQRLGVLLRLGALACVGLAVVAGGEMAVVLIALAMLLGLAYGVMVRRPLRRLVQTHCQTHGR